MNMTNIVFKAGLPDSFFKLFGEGIVLQRLNGYGTYTHQKGQAGELM